MAEVTATLVLDLSQALAEVDSLSQDIDAATSDVSLTLDIESTVDEVQQQIDSLEAEPIDVPIDADTSEAEAELAGLGDSIPPIEVPVDVPPDAEASIDGITDAIGGLEVAAAGLGAGALGLAVGEVVQAFSEAERVGAVTGQILENVGASAGVTAEDVSALALSVQEYSGFSDEAVTQAAGIVASFENISNSADGTVNTFDRTITASADLAVAMGQDVTAAASTLSRALADPEKAAARLRRAKIILSESEQALIASFVEVGDVASAQGVILDAVERKYGGVAEAAGATLSGSLDRASEAFGNILEVVGGGVAVAFSPFIAQLASVTELFTGLPGPVQAFIGAFVGVTLVVGAGAIAYSALAAAATTATGALVAANVAALATNPVFLAIAGAAAVLVGVYAALTSGGEEAAEASDAYTQALRDQADGIDGAVARSVALEAAEAGIVSTARDAGVSLEDLTGSILGTRDAVPGLRAELDQLVAAQAELEAGVGPLAGDEEAAQANARRIEQLQEIIGYIEEQNGALGASEDRLEAEAAALDAVGTASAATAEEIQAFVDTVVGTLPNLSDAFARAQEAGDAFGVGLQAASDPSVVGANLEQIAFEILAFGENLRVVADAGFAELAASLAELGPETAGGLIRSLADAVRSGQPEVLEAFAEQAALIPGALETIGPVLEGLGITLGTEGGDAASVAFGDALDFTSGAEAEGEGAAGAITSGSGSITGASVAAGEQAATGFANSLSVVTGLTLGTMALVNALIISGGVIATASATTAGTTAGLALGRSFGIAAPVGVTIAMGVVQAQISASGSSLAGSARGIGSQIGVSLGQGITSGIQTQVGAIAAAAAQAVNTAEQAARSAADSNSPSRLFAAVGADMGEGLVLGFEQAASALPAAAANVTFGAAGAVGSSSTDVGGVVVYQTIEGGLSPGDARPIRKASRDGVTDALRTAFDVAHA